MPPGVFTRSYDNSRTGANTHETVLTQKSSSHSQSRVISVWKHSR